MKRFVKKTTSGISPVLFELVIVTLFLAITASIVVQLIGAANSTSRQSVIKSHALLTAQSYAESAKADPQAVLTCLDDSCDHKLLYTDDEGVCYTVLVQSVPTAAGTLYTIGVTAVQDGETLVCFKTARYIAAAEVGE